MSGRKNRLWRWCWRLLLVGVLMVVLANAWVVFSTSSLVRREVAEVEAGATALVLGTSKNVSDGGPNFFFQRRIEAAAELYAGGKVQQLLLSGDHRLADYDEPGDMRKALMEKGVPTEAMILDPAGLRTLDSVVRAKEKFGLTDCIIVTDDFHLPRALFLARHFGLKAVGYESRPLGWNLSAKTRLREYLARVLLLLDLHVLDTQPQTSP